MVTSEGMKPAEIQRLLSLDVRKTASRLEFPVRQPQDYIEWSFRKVKRKVLWNLQWQEMMYGRGIGAGLFVRV